MTSKIRPVFIWMLVLSLCVLLLDRRILDFGWVYFDDDINILFNPHLGGLDWEGVRWAFTDLAYMRRYLPFGYLLWNLQLSLGGFDPMLFHLGSLLLMTGCALGLLLVLRRLGALCGASGWTLEAGAFAGAALWSFHPMRVESIAWISGQLYLGASLFAFLALGFQTTALSRQLSGKRSLPWSVSAGLCYVISLLFYPVYLGLGVLWLLLDLALNWRLKKAWSGWRSLVSPFLRALPWLLTACLCSLVNYLAPRFNTAFGAFPSLDSFGLWERCQLVLANSLSLLGRSVYYDYASPYRGEALDVQAHLLPWLAAALVCVLVLVLLYFRKLKAGTVGLTVFALLASMLPSLGLFDPRSLPADRYSMGPHLVLAVVLVLWLCRPGGKFRWLSWVVVLAMGVSFVVGHVRALDIWRDTDTLQASIDRMKGRKLPESQQKAHVILCYVRPAHVLFSEGRISEAKTRLEEGLAAYPGNSLLLARKEDMAEKLRKDSRLGNLVWRDSLFARLHEELALDWERRGNAKIAEAHRRRAGLDLEALRRRDAAGPQARTISP